MNYSTAIFLISDHARAVMVTYECDENGSKAARTLFKTLNQTIKVDDYVVVPTNTRHHMTVCKVVEIDVEPDFETAKDVEWIIGVVDLADFEDIKRQETEAISRIKSAEKRRMRAELRDKLLDDAGDDVKALPIYSVGGDAPVGSAKS